MTEYPSRSPLKTRQVSGTRTSVDDEVPEKDEELARILEARKRDAGSQPAPTAQDQEAPQETPEEQGTEHRMSEEEERGEDSEGESEGLMEEGETGAGVRGEKRPSDESEEVRDSFDVHFPPNRPAKKPSRKTGGSSDSEGDEVRITNSFSILADFEASPASENM